MEQKKYAKKGSTHKRSSSNLKISISAPEKNTKRRLKSKHKKMLTEGVVAYAESTQLTLSSPKKAWLNTIGDDTTICQRTQASFSKSYHHSHSNSALASDLEQFREQFQKENDRLRTFLDTLQLKNRKVVTLADQPQKEGVSQKIKKQNILLKSTISLKRNK